MKSSGLQIKEQKGACLQELESWDGLEEDRGERVSKINSNSTLWSCLRLEEVEWR